MSKAEWGTKRRCATCGAPFYDMRRSPIRCPACDAEFKPNAPRLRPVAAKRAAAPARPAATASDVGSEEVHAAPEPEDATDDLDDQDEVEDRDDGDDDVPEDPEELGSLDGAERA